MLNVSTTWKTRHQEDKTETTIEDDWGEEGNEEEQAKEGQLVRE